MNVCANCTHLISRRDGPRTGAWYNLRCGAVAEKPSVDPQTGARAYASRNDLGGIVYDDSPHPYARDINPTGTCALYRERILVTLKRRRGVPA